MATALGFALRAYLLTKVTDVGTRIRPNILEQNVVLPAVSYQILFDEPTDDISANAGLFRAQVQYNVFAKTPDAVQPIADKIRLALQGYKGVSSLVDILGVYFVSQFDNYEEEIDNYVVTLRFGVWYNRANPA